MAKTEFHEDYGRSQTVKSGSDRGFGIVFAVVFLVIAVWPLTGDGSVRWWSVGVAAVPLATAALEPKLLAPLNRAWFRFGMLLHRIVTPVILAFLFFVVVMPVGVLMRLTGRDPLNRRFDREAATYWIERRPPGPDPQTMSKQF